MQLIFATQHVGTLTWATGAAILAAQVAPHSSGSASVSAEVLCWVLVVLFYDAVPRFFGVKWGSADLVQTHPLKSLPWVAATCLVVVALSSSVWDARWVLVSCSDVP
jgi:hypothetical protein